MVSVGERVDVRAAGILYEDPRRAKGPMADPKLEGNREFWIKAFKEVMGPMPDNFLPPFREVNHEIPLIDDKLRYNTRAPKCPEAFMAQLQDKTNLYVKQGL